MIIINTLQIENRRPIQRPLGGRLYSAGWGPRYAVQRYVLDVSDSHRAIFILHHVLCFNEKKA
jgi:hypothetical protein